MNLHKHSQDNEDHFDSTYSHEDSAELLRRRQVYKILEKRSEMKKLRKELDEFSDDFD